MLASLRTADVFPRSSQRRWARRNVGAHHAKWSHRVFWAHARLPRKKSIFPPKTHRNILQEGKRWEPYLAFKDFALLCALIFGAGAEIFESRLNTVTSLDSHHVGKQHWTNNEPQDRKKIHGHELSPVYSGKAITNPSNNNNNNNNL